MSEDAKRWHACLWLRELVRQWHAARGYAASGEFQRPFSRDWEDLLEAAGQVSAEARGEAFRDARALEAEELVELKTDKYRPYQIERVIVPFAAEVRLREFFTSELPARPDVTFDPTTVAWVPELRFVTSARPTVAPDDLLKLNAFLQQCPDKLSTVPVKERSLEIFGDEKRLDALLTTSLFRHDRLTLHMLRCELIGEPLGWRRGPPNAAEKPLLVIENAATWHSYCRWNAERGVFSAVVYGKGFQSAASVHYLADNCMSTPRKAMNRWSH